LITGIVGSHDRTGQVAATVQNLARDHGIGISTCYRYLHEAITVLAPAASELPEVLHERLAAGDTHVILDGTLIRSDRGVVTTQNEKGKTINLWYSGKHKAFGGNVQFGVDRRRISVVVLRGVPRQPPRPGRSARTRCDRGVVRRSHERTTVPGGQGLLLRGRLVLGSGAYEAVHAALAARLAEVEAQRDSASITTYA
jgi:hypothetical protein